MRAYPTVTQESVLCLTGTDWRDCVCVCMHASACPVCVSVYACVCVRPPVRACVRVCVGPCVRVCPGSPRPSRLVQGSVWTAPITQEQWDGKSDQPVWRGSGGSPTQRELSFVTAPSDRSGGKGRVTRSKKIINRSPRYLLQIITV